MVKRYGLGAEYGFEYPEAMRMLGRAKHDGALDALPQLAANAVAALAPIGMSKTLLDRLTMLGMAMANGKDQAQVTAWLHETARLLSDLPQPVLFDAIDECVKEPGRVFLPSVGEIREKASAPLRRQERIAARLNMMANLLAEGADIPEWVEPTLPPHLTGCPPVKKEEPRCTPEEAAAILAEFGLKSSYSTKLTNMLTPEAPKTRQQMVAEGREPPPLAPKDVDSWEMMP